jgi:hypothetical protein
MGKIMSDIPEFYISEGAKRLGAGLFVLIEGPDHRHLIHVGGISSHKSVYSGFLNQNKIGSENYKPVGGGRIYYRPTEIEAFDYSGDFGKFDQDITRDILERNSKGRKVTIR